MKSPFLLLFFGKLRLRRLASCSSSSSKSSSAAAAGSRPSSSSSSSSIVNDIEILPSPSASPQLGIGRSVISKLSSPPSSSLQPSLQDLLLKAHAHGLCPETIRRFWRISPLQPGDFLEILTAAAAEEGDYYSIQKKADLLLSLFRWPTTHTTHFTHLPPSYQIITSILVRARRLQDARSLLLEAEEEMEVISSSNCAASTMFSDVILGYANALELDVSFHLFHRARSQGLILSPSCYQSLLHLSIQMGKGEMALRVYTDMMDQVGGLGSGLVESRLLDSLVGTLLLSKEDDGKNRLLDAVNILKRAREVSDVEPGPAALSAIAQGYCRKKDFDDMLNFLEEWKHVPDAPACNKIVSTLCRDLGSDEAWLLVQRMEVLGFEPDAITFGILVGQSCTERNLRSAFVYLSECSARGIKPAVYTYNAVISGLFLEGMHWCAKDAFEDMVEKGLMPDRSTFRVLLAGYCKYRKFDEVKRVLNDMINCGLVSLDTAEDALSKAFMMLGLDRFGVKVKRDNSAGHPRAEFFDSLGNGLYLETDVDKYDMTLSGLLDAALVPDLDSLLLEECRKGDVEAVVRVVDEVVQLGQNVTLSTYSELLKIICACSTHVRKAIDLLDEMPELSNQLDGGILNVLVRTLSKNGMLVSAKLILDRLFKRDLLVETVTYNALIIGFWRERNISSLRECLELAQISKYPLGSKDIKDLVSCLCDLGMIKEMLELLDNILDRRPDLICAFCSTILTELSLTGFTNVGCQLVEEVLKRGVVLDHTTCINLIEWFTKEHKFAEAHKIVDHFLEKKIIPFASVYLLLIPSLFRLNSIPKAMILKQTVLTDQFEAAVSVYSALVNEFCKIGKIKEATLELQEMLVNKVFPDDNALNALIEGYCRENNFGKAIEILAIMLRKHVELSIQGYRSLVRQMCLQGNELGALRLVQLIQGENESRLLILCNILIFHLFQSEKSVLVESLVKNMREKDLNSDTHTYNFLVYGFYKCGNVSRSVNTLYTMINKGLRPSNRSLRTVICYLCSHGKLDKALELSKVMECSGWKYGSVVQNAITGGLLSRGRLSEAELFLVQVKEKNLIPNNINYDILIKQLCLLGSTTRAIDLLNIMLKKGNAPSEMSYSLVICNLCRCKLYDRALDLHAEMLHKNLKPWVYSSNTLIYGLCLNGRTDDAKMILNLLLQIGQVPTQSMYSCVIDRYYTENNLEKASELLLEMQQMGHSPNFETHWSLISNLNSFNRKGDDGCNAKGILSRLLSGSRPLAKNFEDKGTSVSKYASIPS